MLRAYGGVRESLQVPVPAIVFLSADAAKVHPPFDAFRPRPANKYAFGPDPSEARAVAAGLNQTGVCGNRSGSDLQTPTRFQKNSDASKVAETMATKL